ncbi:PREDICTED: probable BOI-related E3 ubiquitin-protein ligase 3 [Ipomoea nil]|uniref:probable BOI-related E3 ubiquitin-protein ligase 3 n=1 Tax=Ipomoea nil TaxID=35883 RepID=UPI00090150FC|nr:PREDICTED: probable BOI-related E3 ubiquitin-protein ligase 3 [Ipomoea nil]
MAIQAEWCSENPVFLSSDNACAAGLDAFSRLCFHPPPPQQPQPHHHHQQQQEVHFLEQRVNQNFGNVMAPMHPQQVMPDWFPLNLVTEFERQKLDLDRFICLQNERLRFGVQEQRKEQVGLILRMYEAKMQVLLKHKEGELRVAMKKRSELENLVKRLESEKQAWEQLAKEKEAMVASVNKTLEQVRVSAAEDAESCCVHAHDDDHDQVLFFLDQGNEGDQLQPPTSSNLVCKSCNLRGSCIVFLPCRHLSSCKPCEAFLHSCPICRMHKKTTILPLL